MALAGDCRRRSTGGLTGNRMPVGALSVIVCRLALIVNARGPFNTVTCPVRVNMRERRSAAP